MEDPPLPTATRLIPDLPDDISVQIISRIPRSHHRTLCYVSRSWRSLLLSRLLFTLRSSLTYSTESTLCLNIRTQTNQSPWLILDRGRSYPTSLPSPPLATIGSACTTVGPFVFVLGGSLSEVPSNVVQILDLRIGGHWFLGPRMSTAREFAAASFLNGRVYAIGGCLPSSKAWAESFDPFDSNPHWVPVDSPVHMRKKWMHGCVVLSGKILAMADRGGVAYDPSHDTCSGAEKIGPVQNSGLCSAWGPVPKRLDLGWKGRAVVVNGILYSYDYMGKIKGYDPVMDKWRSVLGVDKHLPKFLSGATLANLDGILCVIWEHRRNGGRQKEMAVDWAGIRVTDLCEKGLHGSILWWVTVPLGLPYASTIAHCAVAEF